jgi:hypothetical protein
MLLSATMTAARVLKVVGFHKAVETSASFVPRGAGVVKVHDGSPALLKVEGGEGRLGLVTLGLQGTDTLADEHGIDTRKDLHAGETTRSSPVISSRLRSRRSSRVSWRVSPFTRYESGIPSQR